MNEWKAWRREGNRNTKAIICCVYAKIILLTGLLAGHALWFILPGMEGLV